MATKDIERENTSEFGLIEAKQKKSIEPTGLLAGCLRRSAHVNGMAGNSGSTLTTTTTADRGL